MRKVKQRDYKKLTYNIYSFYNDKRKMPTFEEMKHLFGVSSKDTVHRIVSDLVGMGNLQKDKTGKLLPVADEMFRNLSKNDEKKLKKLFSKNNSLQTGKRKSYEGVAIMLGSVEAGFPTFVEAGELDTITLDEWLIGDKSATFILKVKGDSMTDEGILDGDYVIVERGLEPKLGDVVLANVDGAWTLKYYKKDKAGIYLEPANKKFKIIRPKESLEIPAVVVSVIRKYKK